MSDIPKILLVTMTPPGDGNVGEIILRDLCRFLPPEQLALFTLAPSKPTNKYPWPSVYHNAPVENPWPPLGGKIGSIFCHLNHRYVFSQRIREAENAIVQFGRKVEAQIVWLVLNSIPMVSLGGTIAKRIGIPQVSIVWDPPDWHARRLGMDRLSRGLLARRFGEALKKSERVAVVSEAMKEEYARAYGSECVILRHALENASLGQAKTDVNAAYDAEFRIGFAGTMYDTAQFNILLNALHLCDWKIDSRPVVLRMIGNWFRFNGMRFPCNVELLGWRSTGDSHRLLSECDIHYLPIPFSSEWEDFARLSFPTKLSTYLATGKPVFIHGPSYCSSVKFCDHTGFGLSATSLEPKKILAKISNFVENKAVYQRATENVAVVRQKYFSMFEMRQKFADLIGVEADDLCSK